MVLVWITVTYQYRYCIIHHVLVKGTDRPLHKTPIFPSTSTRHHSTHRDIGAISQSSYGAVNLNHPPSLQPSDSRSLLILSRTTNPTCHSYISAPASQGFVIAAIRYQIPTRTPHDCPTRSNPSHPLTPEVYRSRPRPCPVDAVLDLDVVPCFCIHPVPFTYIWCSPTSNAKLTW